MAADLPPDSGSDSSKATTQDLLVDRLTLDLKPVARLVSAHLLSFGFVFSAVVSVVILLFVFSEFRRAMPIDPVDFWTSFLSSLGCLGLGFCLSLSLARSRVPGAHPGSTTRWAVFSLVLISGWLAVASRIPLQGSYGLAEAQSGILCSDSVLLLALPLMMAALWIVRRGAPMRPIKSAVFAAGAAVSVCAALLPLVCADARPVHLLISHLFLPLSVAVLGLAAVVALFRRNLFRI